MLLTKTIVVKWISKTKNHYESLGYVFTKFYDEFEISIEHLTKGSGLKVEVLCDYCKKNIILKEYKTYMRERSNDKVVIKDCCLSCSHEKFLEVHQIKYGGKMGLAIPEVKEKYNDTIQENHGVSYAMQIPEAVEKAKISKIEKYGDFKSYLTEESSLKKKNTNLLKYGGLSPFSDEKVRQKRINTNLERYGENYYLQSLEFKEWFKNYCLEVYGVEYIGQAEEIKEKISNTIQDKYGYSTIMSVPEIREKAKNSLLDRYGVDSYMKTEEYKIKISGENNWNWKGGITPEYKLLRSSVEYKNWQKSVLERDYYTCQCCGKHVGNLHAHHIKNFSSNDELRFDIDNGITLCGECHIYNNNSFHKIYGYFDNDISQLNEYINNYKNNI